jgi:hypothetical protein
MDYTPLQKMATLIFELEKKVLPKDNNSGLERIILKMKRVLEENNLYIYDPSGEKYTETRTDVEANIVSQNSGNNLYISQVIKPIIYIDKDGIKQLLQKGVVTVESN